MKRKGALFNFPFLCLLHIVLPWREKNACVVKNQKRQRKKANTKSKEKVGGRIS